MDKLRFQDFFQLSHLVIAWLWQILIPPFIYRLQAPHSDSRHLSRRQVDQALSHANCYFIVKWSRGFGRSLCFWLKRGCRHRIWTAHTLVEEDSINHSTTVLVTPLLSNYMTLVYLYHSGYRGATFTKLSKFGHQLHP